MARPGCSLRAPIQGLLTRVPGSIPRSAARMSSHAIRGTSKRSAPVSARRGYSSHPSKPPKQGQPLAASHPHLVDSKHLTTGIPASEYEERRKQLMESLGEGAVVVCMGNTVRLVTQQIFYKFRQATDFYYLTGFNEPDATLILQSAPSTPRGYKYTLFVPPRDAHEALWGGEVSGVEGAVSTFRADEAFSNSTLASHLGPLISSENLYCSLPPSPSPSASSQPFQPPPPRRRSSLLKLFSHDSTSWSAPTDPPHLMLAAALASDRAKPLEREVQKMRLIKSRRELRLMKAAADLSADAHTQVMRFAKAGGTEAALAAHFEYTCALGGAERPAYVPVVASGANSLVIHYTNNDCVLDSDDLVLIDAGCEKSMYASDITRTFPVSGTFTAPQKDLYEAVLSAQKECVKRCKIEDQVSMNELHRASCVLLNEELRQIGFKLSVGDVERRLYPHFLSHHLGSDLHDCPTADRSARLVEGNVITVEPGIYVPFDNSYPKHFHGLGVRIEDEVAFTKDGPLVLSANAPKEIADVEAACRGTLDRNQT